MYSVLIVEDEPLAAEAHMAYVARVPDFAVAGHAKTGREALRLLASDPVDLVLLDMYLPDMHGLDVVRRMRAAGHTAYVVVVTRARDLAVVQAAVSYGIAQYLIKPFTFAALRDKLERYRTYREHLMAAHEVVTQAEVDELLGALRSTNPADLPKGMSRETLDAIVATLRAGNRAALSAGEAAELSGGLSAGEAALALGASRVTARRYLEYLAEIGVAVRRTRYGSAHRPEVEYRLREGYDSASGR